MREQPITVHDHHDRYTLTAFIDEENRKIILGAIYMRPSLMKDNISNIQNQYLDVSNTINDIINQKGCTVDDINFYIGGDFNTNMDGDTFRLQNDIR